MPNFKTITSGVAAAVISATMAMAGGDAVPPGDDGFTKVGEVEGWGLFVDNQRKTCMIERMDEAENIVQMGLTADREFGYLGVFTKADIGIRKGKKEKIYIDIDGTLYWSESTGMKGNITEGYSGGYILANNPQFINDVANKYTMTVFPRKQSAFVVDLAGTKKAIAAARECTEEQS